MSVALGSVLIFESFVLLLGWLVPRETGRVGARSVYSTPGYSVTLFEATYVLRLLMDTEYIQNTESLLSMNNIEIWLTTA